MQNTSPWIHQLNHEREVHKLTTDIKTDIVVIGAGIAGVSTAFFLLKHTNKKVVIAEAYKLAHGATGHNAGQLLSYFERPFKELVEEFGLEMAAQGQRDLDSAWELADLMYTEAGLSIPLFRFEGYAGYSTKKQVLLHLENSYLRRSAGLYSSDTLIQEDATFIHEIPEKYHNLIKLVPLSEISLRLETFDSQYIAVSSLQKGVMNSALFCQEILDHLLEKYKDRFTLYEHTPIKKVVVHPTNIILDAESHTVECDKVVLCTNGFDNFNILTSEGLAVNSRFHHNINGVVGFMTGYLEEFTGVPTALSYIEKHHEPNSPYFYVTRRPYEYNENKHNLISIGGPEFELAEKMKYDRELEFSAEAKKEIDEFVKRTYDKRDLDYIFMWHGVMGYTKNLVRMIGPDYNFPSIHYNLGCNGIGLLPSIYGGSKVARLIAGEKFDPSIFDTPAVVEINSEQKTASIPS